MTLILPYSTIIPYLLKTLSLEWMYKKLLRLYTSISLQVVLYNPQTLVVSKGLRGINIITREH